MTSNSEFYGGIFVERDILYVGISELDMTNTGDGRAAAEIIPLGHEEINIDRELPLKALEAAVTTLVDGSPKLKGIGVASYGPFKSLHRVDLNIAVPEENKFGVIDREKDDEEFAFAGVDFIHSIRGFLSNMGLDPNGISLDVQTDATAGAIGEAYRRNLKPGQMLVYLYLTDGIGGGVVVGKSPLPSFLHPEMGLLHVRLLLEDEYIQSLPQYDPKNTWNVGEICSISSVMRRASSHLNENVDTELLKKVTSEDVWRFPAYYIAQLCLACTSIVSPEMIVLGGPLARYDVLRGEIYSAYSGLLKPRWTAGHKKIEDIKKYLLKGSDLNKDYPEIILEGTVHMAINAAMPNNHLRSIDG